MINIRRLNGGPWAKTCFVFFRPLIFSSFILDTYIHGLEKINFWKILYILEVSDENIRSTPRKRLLYLDIRQIRRNFVSIGKLFIIKKEIVSFLYLGYFIIIGMKVICHQKLVYLNSCWLLTTSSGKKLNDSSDKLR